MNDLFLFAYVVMPVVAVCIGAIAVYLHVRQAKRLK